MSDDFVLDRVENPHPRMLAEALDLRARWLGYLQAMCAATGETPADIEAWMDQPGPPSMSTPHAAEFDRAMAWRKENLRG